MHRINAAIAQTISTGFVKNSVGTIASVLAYPLRALDARSLLVRLVGPMLPSQARMCLQGAGDLAGPAGEHTCSAGWSDPGTKPTRSGSRLGSIGF